MSYNTKNQNALVFDTLVNVLNRRLDHSRYIKINSRTKTRNTKDSCLLSFSFYHDFTIIKLLEELCKENIDLLFAGIEDIT